jgi:signal transduction histidine kinase
LRAHHVRTSVFDSVLAVLLCATALAGLALRAHSADLAEVVLVCLGALCLTWRRSAPMTVFGVCAGTYCGYKALGYDYSILLLVLLIALYTLASTSASSVAATALCALVVAAAGAEVLGAGWPPPDFDDRVIGYLLAMSAACMFGYGVQLTRARTELLSRQAVRLSKEHALHEEQVLHQQQNLIARELHDVVAHQVSVITALAAGAHRVFDAEPDRARDALTAIETAGRDALVEMRRLLRVLRTDASTDLSLQPHMADIPALAAQIEAACLPVDLVIAGNPVPLPAGVELCAYRIVQEALTNALKYAGPARAVVRLAYRPDGVEVVVRDNGRGMAELGSGQGLVGMRERAALLGGWLAVGAAAGGGVQVRAFLPVGAPGPDAPP